MTAADGWPAIRTTVWRTLRARLGRCEELEDVAQDAYLHVLANLPRLRQPGSLLGFVRAITVTVALRAIRRRRRERRRLGGPLEPVGVAEADLRTPSPEEAADGRWMLERLDDRQRRVLLLRHQGFTLEEAAAALGSSLATTKRILRDACARATTGAVRPRGRSREAAT